MAQHGFNLNGQAFEIAQYPQPGEVSYAPLRDLYFIKRDTPEETVRNGIVIPGARQEKVYTGVVMMAGDGFKGMGESGQTIGLTCGVGDRVFYSPAGVFEIEIDGVMYHAVTETSVLARQVKPPAKVVPIN